MNAVLLLLVIGVVVIGGSFMLFQAIAPTSVQQPATGLAAGAQAPAVQGSTSQPTSINSLPDMVGGC